MPNCRGGSFTAYATWGTTRFTPSTLNAATRRQTRVVCAVADRDDRILVTKEPGRLPCEQVGTHKVLIRLGAQCLDFGSQRFRDTAQLVLGRFSLAVRFTANLRDVLFGRRPSLVGWRAAYKSWPAEELLVRVRQLVR